MNTPPVAPQTSPPKPQVSSTLAGKSAETNTPPVISLVKAQGSTVKARGSIKTVGKSAKSSVKAKVVRKDAPAKPPISPIKYHASLVKSRLSQPNLNDGLDGADSCARTLGLRVAKEFSPAQLAVLCPQASSEVDGTGTGTGTVKGMIKKILKTKNWSFFESLTNRPALVGGAWDLSPFRIMKSIPALAIPEVEIAGGVLAEIASLPSAQDSNPTPTTSSSSPSAPPLSGYQPYASPLQMFGSYQLNPAFFSGAGSKPSLGSLTYSTKIDPNKVMCKFELTGTCSDPKCTAQHIRDLAMTREEVVRDIVSYTPTLAGCTTREVGVAIDEPKTAEGVADKISTYCNMFVSKYGVKLTDQMFYKLAVHETNVERTKTGARKDSVHFGDRPWLQSSGVGGGVAETGPRKAATERIGGGVARDLLHVGPGVGVKLSMVTTKVEDERR